MNGRDDLETLFPRNTLLIMVATFLAVLFVYAQESDVTAKIQLLLLITSLTGIAYLIRLVSRMDWINANVIEVPLALSGDAALFDSFQEMSLAYKQVRQIPAPIFRETALQRLKECNSQISELGKGTLVFQNTESWRIVYERLLNSKVVFLYKSVAWLRDESYWQHEPGQKSLQVAFHLVADQQIAMKRMMIVSENLWNANSKTPEPWVANLVAEHHRYGIPTRLIRESDLSGESDLLVDFGLYDSFVMGQQTFDEMNGTSQFVLKFNLDAVIAAERLWDRLYAFSKPSNEILEVPP